MKQLLFYTATFKDSPPPPQQQIAEKKQLNEKKMPYFLSFQGNQEVCNKISYLSTYDISLSSSDRSCVGTFLAWEERARIRSVAIGWPSRAQPSLPGDWHARESLQNTVAFVIQLLFIKNQILQGIFNINISCAFSRLNGS